MSVEITVEANDSIRANNGGNFTITDANGKKMDITLGDIINASTTAPSDISLLSDCAREKMLNFSPTITDSVGTTITDSELLDLVKSGEAIALDVTFEATHSGENLNNAVYTSVSLEQDAQSWMFPFAKPLIKNHNMNEEPIGRAVDATFGQSEFDTNRDCINVTYRVSDQDAMTKFADGRYKTMSIGATSGYIRCNICGKDVLKDSKVKFCGHWKGETYAGKKATWTVENMTYREGSIVNAPADVYAQVKNIRVVNKKKEDNGMKNQTDSMELLDDMDSILNSNNDTEQTPEPSQEPVQDTTTTEVETTTTDAEEKSELEMAQDKIAELEVQVATLTTDKEAIEAKLTEANDSIALMTTDNEALKADVNKYKEQSVRMAQFNLKLMKDNLVELNPELSDAELEGKSAREIADMINELKSKAQTRDFTTRVHNPGAPVKDNNDVEDGEEEEEEPKVLTMKDMEDVVSGIFGNKH